MAKQKAVPSGQDQEGIQRRRNLDKNILHIDLSTRTSNRLERHGIFFVGELVQLSSARLAGVRGIGRKSLHEVKRMLGGLGLSLAMDIGDWKPPVSDT